MKHIFTKYLLTAGLLCVAATLMADNDWQRVVVNYTRQEYRSGNQNWQIAQSREGWMYFANNKGLLEFDGNSWHTYPLPGNAKVRSVCAVNDTIFVGALGQFGRFGSVHIHQIGVASLAASCAMPRDAWSTNGCRSRWRKSDS